MARVRAAATGELIDAVLTVLDRATMTRAEVAWEVDADPSYVLRVLVGEGLVTLWYATHDGFTYRRGSWVYFLTEAGAVAAARVEEARIEVLAAGERRRLAGLWSS